MSDTIRSIGAQMATMMYNLSQGANLPAGTRDLMRDMHQRWDAAVSADRPPPPQPQMVAGEKIDFPKILYVCEVCFAGNQESCGNDREGMNIVPDGRWMCDGCRDDENIDVSTCKSVPELFTAPPATDHAVGGAHAKAKLLCDLLEDVYNLPRQVEICRKDLQAALTEMPNSAGSQIRTTQRCGMDVGSDDRTSPVAPPSTIFPDGFFDDQFEASSDDDTHLQAAAREAGWALSALVDEIKFEKRQQVVNIINRLSAALWNSPPPMKRDAPVDNPCGDRG